MKLHLAQWRFHKQQVTQVHCKNSSKWRDVLSALSILEVFTMFAFCFSKSVSHKWLYPSANFLDFVHPSSLSDILLFLCAAEILLDVKLQEEGWHMLSSRQGLSGNSWPTLWCVWATVVERNMIACDCCGETGCCILKSWVRYEIHNAVFAVLKYLVYLTCVLSLYWM